MVVPKVAFVTISRVVLPAVDTVGRVRSQHAFSHGGNQGSCFCISLATSGEGVVMLPSMRSHAERALGLQGTTGWGGVTPLPTTLAECHARVSLGGMDICDLLPHLVLGQHHWISQNRCHVGSTRIQGWVRWDWWGDCDQIRSGMVRGWLVEIGASHQIWWNILREHNWGVPSAHIKFIYYVTYILEYLIVLWGCVHTGVYTIL